MSKRTFFFSFILFCALILSLWLIHHSFSSTVEKKINTKQTADAFMKNATYLSFDTDGKLHNKIYVIKMLHYPYEDTSNFFEPQIVFYTDKRAPWYVSANKGQSKNGIDTVHLWDNVKIHEPGSKQNNELNITTSSLIIFPKTKLVTTDQPITIIQPGTTVNAVGLHADLKKGEVILLSHAQGIFETASN